MIKRFSIIRIMKMTILLFVLFIFYLFPNKNKYEIKTNVVNLNVNYHDIFLLDKRGYVSKTTIAISSVDKEKIAYELLSSLIIEGENKNKLPEGFNGTIPKNTKIEKIKLENEYISVSFSKDIINSDIKEKMIESIVYTLTSISGVNKVYLVINNKEDDYFDKLYTRKIGINKEYDINTLHDINHFTVYYVSNDNIDYYVPVTKIINSNEDKIKIIIDELSSRSSIESSLISYLNHETKLINYNLEDGDLNLYFNEEILKDNSDNVVLEEIKSCIKYSISDSYDIKDIHFFSNNKEF